jgi:hypothetical protein
MEFESAARCYVKARVTVDVGQIGNAPQLRRCRFSARYANAQHEDADLALRAHALRFEPVAIPADLMSSMRTVAKSPSSCGLDLFVNRQIASYRRIELRCKRRALPDDVSEEIKRRIWPGLAL